MILLTPPKFTHTFENSSPRSETMEQEKDYLDACFAENDEYIEVFSPTVFETVEVYTSSSDNSENQDVTFETDDSSTSAFVNEINIDSIDTVSSLENLEPGTYTLDVLESNDFDFDGVFVNDYANDVDKRTANIANENTAPNKNGNCKRTATVGEKKKGERTSKKYYKLRNCDRSRSSSARKTLSTKCAKNVTARDFLNKFSHDLSKSAEKVTTLRENEEDGKSLSWLLDFKISSIFHPVEGETDNAEKHKRKLNDAQKKPRYTYTELIEQALKENGELTVSGIYNWISNRYPYYQQHDDRWKNSVRHNLSINPQFRKGKKASQGAGHFWNISDSLTQNLETKDTLRTTNLMTNIISEIDEEVLAATKSIQETENMDFTDVADVSLHDAAEQLHLDTKQTEPSFVNITRSDIEQLWESANDITDYQRFHSFSPLIRELSEESESAMEEDNFLIQDIHNSICLGDELFTNGLNSPYYGLTTI